MSRHLSAANTVESKPWASAERAGRRSSVTATRVNERTDTGFRPPQGVWNGVTHISTEWPNPARASRRRPGCVSEPQSLGIGIAGISIGFSLMDDLASAPRPVSARSPCLPCVFTSPKGTSRDAHTSPPSSVVTWSAERAGGYGDRLPAHHVGAPALSGPVEGGGILSPLLAHHSGHLTGDPHGRLGAHLEDKRARRLQSGGEAAGEDLHDAALAGILAGEAHLEPVKRRVSRALRADDGQAQLSHA